MSRDTDDLERIGAGVLKRLRESDENETARDIQTLVFKFAAEEEAKLPPPDATQGDPQAHERAQAVLAKAVRQLPADEREALMIHICDGMTYKQIAERLGVPPAAVLRHLRMAYSKLREAVSLEKAG